MDCGRASIAQISFSMYPNSNWLYFPVLTLRCSRIGFRQILHSVGLTADLLVCFLVGYIDETLLLHFAV